MRQSSKAKTRVQPSGGNVRRQLSRTEKNINQSPLVTIFGAGVAGLSAAHELIERGFTVQVVESTRSPDEEYSVEVGGMARNQFCRIQEDPRILHGPEPVHERALEPVDPSWPVVIECNPRTRDLSRPPELTRALNSFLEALKKKSLERANAEHGPNRIDWQIIVEAYSETDPRSEIDAHPETKKIARRYVRAMLQRVETLRESNEEKNKDYRIFSECRFDTEVDNVPGSKDFTEFIRLRIKPPMAVFRGEVEKIFALRPPEMKKVQTRFTVPERIQFERTSGRLDRYLEDDWGVPNQIKLISVWQTLKRAYLAYHRDFQDDLERARHQRETFNLCDSSWRCREILYVEVRGHTDNDGEEQTNRRISKRWADSVITALETLNRTPQEAGPLPLNEFRHHFRGVGVGSAEPIGDPRDSESRRQSNRVEFRIVERLIPGEHGYRFFPAYYRHLFDTMRRTPILDPGLEATGETVYQHLTPVRDVGIAFADGMEPTMAETRPVQSLEEFRCIQQLFLGRLGFTFRDIARFQARILKFLTSSSARREKEYENQNWWTFLGGRTERGYSRRMEEFLKQAPQALVAMNAEETDARSQGDVVCQLHLHYFRRQFDQSLNGPTTRVWLRDWKRYLKRQGVRFFLGELGKLEWRENFDLSRGPELVGITTSFAAALPRKNIPEEAQQEEEALVSAPSQQKETTPDELIVEVLGTDAGEYTVLVSGKPHSVTVAPASPKKKEEIAQALIKSLEENTYVTADHVGLQPGQLRISHKPDQGPQGNTQSVKLVGPLPGDARYVEVYYTDGPSWKENGVKVIPIQAFLSEHPERIGPELEELLDAAIESEKILKESGPRHSILQELALLPELASSKGLRSSTVRRHLNPHGKKADRLEFAKWPLLDKCIFRLLRDMQNCMRALPPAVRSDFQRLIAGLLARAFPVELIQIQVERFLQRCLHRGLLSSRSKRQEAQIHHFAARFAREKDDDLGFVCTLDLDGSHWLLAAELRKRQDKGFLTKLARIEKRLRGLVPSAVVERARPDPNSKERHINAIFEIPEDLQALGQQTTPYADDVLITDRQGNVCGGSADLVDQGPIWIVVRNADGNLRILREPVPEDPEDDYFSHEEDQAAFQPDFYIMALPFEQASSLVWRAELEQPRVLDGCLSELLEFDRCANRRTQQGTEVRLIRDVYGRPPQTYPLRDFSGIQYYFRNQVRIGRGHLYYQNAEWGLSSISQLAYWRERMGPTSPFLGQLSVDIGNMYAPAKRLGSGHLRSSAWRSTSQEIAHETWRQLREGMEFLRASVLAAPEYFHLDDWLRFEDRRGSSFRAEVYVTVSVPTGDSSLEKKTNHFSNRSLSSARIGLEATPPQAESVGPTGDYVIWVNGERFAVEVAEDPDKRFFTFNRVTVAPDPTREDQPQAHLTWIDKTIAETFAKLINTSDCGTFEAEVRLDDRGRLVRRMESLPDGDGIDRNNAQETAATLRIRSKVPPNGALICVTGGHAGNYEVWVDGKRFYHSQTDHRPLQEIRDSLFASMLSYAKLAVIPDLQGTTAILLMPKAGSALPPIRVQNEQQNLNLIFGEMLHVRLEQQYDRLWFRDPELASIGYNWTPFLINVPGQFKFRPGVTVPLAQPKPAPVRAHKTSISYRISNKRWVGAGTFMATGTRLTTMEAANESARHAVNAILQRLMEEPGKDYNAQGRMLAEFADIWDPELNELDDLDPLKRLDERLLNEGLPHVMDIFKIIDAVDDLPMQGEGANNPLSGLAKVFQQLSDEFAKEQTFSRDMLLSLFGKAADTLTNPPDPLGILRGGLNLAGSDISERFQRGVRSFLEELTGLRSNSSPPPPTGG